MDLSPYLPALKVPLDGIFIGDFFGFLLALPVALFLAFWMSDVKKRSIVVLGAFIGALIGFIFILGWVGTLIYDQPLPNANPTATFFGSLLICSVLGLAGGIILDLIVASRSSRDYRRQTLVHE
jgi:quinol-cytochrome oxidoreductase complex cytochrome b subunit